MSSEVISHQSKPCKPTMVQVACKQCGKTRMILQSKVNEGNGVYCNRQCWNEWDAPRNRVWRFITKADSCWLWNGSRSNAGYGQLRIKNKLKTATRVMWELVNGAIPEGIEVCHNCPGGDNPRCVNPAHLFLGTRRDNVDDALRKGRLTRGERCRWAKLTEQNVLDIRTAYVPRVVTMRSLATKYSVSMIVIHCIIHRKTWTHI